MLASRLSTQVGVLFFVASFTLISVISWQHYSEVVYKLPHQAEAKASRDADLIAASISNRVLFHQIYPLWSQMRKVQTNYRHHSTFSIRSFAVVDEKQHVLSHSDPHSHPLMSKLDVGKPGTSWSGRTLHVVVPVLHSSSNRILGSLLLDFDASFLQQKADKAKHTFFLYLLIATCFSALLAFGIRQRVTKQLKQLSGLMPRVGTGDIRNEPFQQAPLEVRRLANALHAVDTALAEKSKQANQLVQVIEQAEEMVILTDIDGVILYVNPAFERISGFNRSEALGQTPRMVKSGEHDQDYYARMWSILLAGKVWQVDFKNRSKNGDIYEVTQTITPLLDEHGEITGFAAVQHDVTEQRKMDRKMQHADRVDSLGVLAGGIAHDFNNLLTAILGNASIASKKLDQASPAHKYIQNIESASLSAADLCRQMLAYSGKGQFVIKPVNLTELIEGMGKLIEVSIAKSIVIRYQLAETLPMIDADIAQIQQVALNFLTNASEAIGDKSGVISLATGVMHADGDYLHDSIGEAHLKPGRYVYLEVSDTGCGMDTATQNKIFDPFFTTKFTGRGLGMSAILGIIKGHHGALRIYSEPGQGTSFRVLFPESESQHWQEDQAAAVSIQGSGSVLIVDDEETIREVAAAMLDDMGFTTLPAANGMEGVETYQQNQEDIAFVLLDMTMPKMNGEECFRHLRQINPEVRVILSSGYNEQEATSRFAGKGLAGFLQKPYTPQQLTEVIATLQGNAQTTQS